jgi:acyl-CoA thioester hydrolase
MKVTHKIEVRFADIDVMGHVNNAIYLSYFEQARMKFFEELVGKEWDWETHGILLARNEIDYRAPVLLNDQVYVETELVEMGIKSMTVGYKVKVEREGKEIICTEGKSVLVAFDYHKGKSQPIPKDWKEKLAK